MDGIGGGGRGFAGSFVSKVERVAAPRVAPATSVLTIAAAARLRLGREIVERTEPLEAGLRQCVLLKQALRHPPPARIARSLGLPVEVAPPALTLRAVAVPSAVAEPATDRKHPSRSSLEPPWAVGEAAERARRFLARHGIGDPAAVPQAQCYPVCRAILLEALKTLPDENLSHVTEALARQLGRAAAGKDLQDKFLKVVIDRAGSDQLPDARAVELVSGALRACSSDPQAADAAFQVMVRRAFVGTFRAFEQHGRQSGRDGKRYDPAQLYRAFGALASAAGGSRMGAARFQALTGVIDDMLVHAGTDAGHVMRLEDLALVLRKTCQDAGGPDLPSALREQAMAQVCSPSRPYPAALRGAMVYQLGMALRLWEQPPALQRSLLAAIVDAGLGREEVGTMAWALGLHLAGNPVKHGWHSTYEHIVQESTAPGDVVIMALAKLGDARLWQSLRDGVACVVPQAVLEAADAFEEPASPTDEPPLSLPPVSPLSD